MQWSRKAILYLTCNDRWAVVPGFLSSKSLTLRKKSCRLTRKRVVWSSFACVGSLRSEKKPIPWSTWMDLPFYYRSYLVCKCTVSCMAGQTVTRFFATMEELLDLFERPVCCQEHCWFIDLGRNMTFFTLSFEQDKSWVTFRASLESQWLFQALPFVSYSCRMSLPRQPRHSLRLVPRLPFRRPHHESVLPPDWDECQTHCWCCSCWQGSVGCWSLNCADTLKKREPQQNQNQRLLSSAGYM